MRSSKFVVGGVATAILFCLAPSAHAQESSSFVFTHDLRPASTGAEVRNLQRYLNTHGAVVATTGPGSLGNESTYFGLRTRLAVAHFQELHAADILKPLGLTKGSGNFLASTRAFINRLPPSPVPAASVAPLSRASVSAPAPGIAQGTTFVSFHHTRTALVPTYTVGGTITGLSDTLMLQNNGGDLLATDTDSSFTFSSSLANLLTYVVSIFSEPGNQICLLSNASGTISNADVTSVSVTCYTIPSIVYPPITKFYTFATRTFTLPTPTSSSPGSFTYTSSDSSIATISGTTVTMVGVGTTTITASQATSSPWAARAVQVPLQAYADECFSAPCLNGGTCTNVPPSDFSCSCPAGYSGVLCELSTPNCDGSGPDFCLNGGTCTPTVDGGECACAPGFFGLFCDQTDILQ